MLIQILIFFALDQEDAIVNINYLAYFNKCELIYFIMISSNRNYGYSI